MNTKHEAMAKIIASKVTSIKDVCFNKISRGSICNAVANFWKVSCSKQLRDKLKKMWLQRSLKFEVAKILYFQHNDLPSTYDLLSSSSAKYKRFPVKGDGSCLFRSLSMGLFGTESLHFDIRTEIVQYTVDHWKENLDTLIATCDKIKYDGIDHYKIQMGSDEVYGTDFEISIFSKIFFTNVNILICKGKQIEQIYTIGENDTKSHNSISILFTGTDRQHGHFDFIVQTHQNNKNLIATNESIAETDEEGKSSSDIRFSWNTDNLNKSVENYQTDKNVFDDDDFRFDQDDKICKTDITSDNENILQTTVSKDMYFGRWTVTSNNEIPIESNQRRRKSKDKKLKEKYQKEKKRNNSYQNICVHEVGSFRIATSKITNEYGELINDLLRKFIKQAMIDELHLNCSISFRNGERINIANTVAYAKCNILCHNAKFRFDCIERSDYIMEVTVSSSHKFPYYHKSDKMKMDPIRGDKRKQLKKLPRYSQESVKLGTVQKIASEHRCGKRLVIKSRTLQDLLQSYLEDHKLRDGYIRQFSLPLQVTLYTERQLMIIDESKPVIVHLDATGGDVRKLEDLTSKHIFYCAMVYRASKTVIPISEMFTSEHDTPSIAHFLKVYRWFIHKHKKWPYFHAIVVDWAWVFMNTILSEWNNMSILDYLNVCWEYVTKGTQPKKITYLMSCCAHTMHRFARSIKIKYPELIKIKSFLMGFMARLIMCKNFEELNDTFDEYLNVLLTKSQEEADNYILSIHPLDSGCKAELLNESNEDEESGKFYHKNDDDIDCIEKKPSSSTYYKSPFYKYFWEKFMKRKLIMEEKENSEENISVVNKYYCPDFIERFIIIYMTYCPLWSSILMNLIDPQRQRLSNAEAESYMKIYKHTILENRKNVSLGEIVRLLRENNNLLVTEETLSKIDQEAMITDVNENNKQIDNDEKNDPNKPFRRNRWGRKKSHFKDQVYKKPRNRHMNDKKLIKLKEKIKSKKEDKDKKKKLHLKRSSNTELDECSQFNSSTGSDENQNACAILPNGLMKDKNYYLNSNSAKIYVGMYTSDAKYFYGTQLETPIHCIHFQSILNVERWVDGQVIDAYNSINGKNWNNFTYISTDITGTVLGNFWAKRLQIKASIHKITTQINESLLMPYAFHGHWRLLIAHTKDNILTLMDPYFISADDGEKNRVKLAFTTYLKNCNPGTPLNSLTNITWTFKDSDERPRQGSDDFVNCGVYVMYYIKCITENVQYEKNFSTDKFREDAAETLLEKSVSIKNRCIQCFKIISPEEKIIKCTVCKRCIHLKCINDNEMSTEDEEKPPKRKKKKKQTGEKKTDNDIINISEDKTSQENEPECTKPVVQKNNKRKKGQFPNLDKFTCRLCIKNL